MHTVYTLNIHTQNIHLTSNSVYKLNIHTLYIHLTYAHCICTKHQTQYLNRHTLYIHLTYTLSLYTLHIHTEPDFIFCVTFDLCLQTAPQVCTIRESSRTPSTLYPGGTERHRVFHRVRIQIQIQLYCHCAEYSDNEMYLEI